MTGKLNLLAALCLGSMLLCCTAFAQGENLPGARSEGEAEITLDELLRTAAENSPVIKSAEQAAAASKALVPAASALPDPTVTFENMGKIIPPQLMPGDPSSARTYGVEQEIPFPGKRGLKGSMASAEAEGQQWNQHLVYRQTMSELKQAYFDLYLIRKSIDILLKNKELLQSFVRIAESRYQVGQTTQQDVLKAQVEVSKILERLLSLGEKKRIAEAKVNNLLFRPSGTPVGRPAEITKSELTYSLEDFVQLALSGSPALKAQESEITRRQYGVELAQKGYYPDFAVGFTYYDRDANPEMYRLMVSAKVPLYFWTKQRPELESARLNLSSARSSRDGASSALQFQVKEAYTQATTAEKLIQLYASAIVPQANLALNSAVANYQVGKIDFLQLTDSATSLLEYEIKYYESVVAFQKALAQLEPLTGVDLVH